MYTSSSDRNKKLFSDTESALSDVSKLLSRLCNSRKAGMRLKEITDLTGVVARLTRSLNMNGADRGDSEGYGDPNHYEEILKPRPRHQGIR